MISIILEEIFLIKYILNFIFSAIEVLSILSIPYSVLPKRFGKTNEYTFMALSIFVGSLATNSININIFLKPLIMLLILGICCRILFLGPISIILFYLIIGMYIVTASELVLANIVYFFPAGIIEGILRSFWIEIFLTVCVKIVIIILGITFVRYISKFNPRLSETYWFGFDLFFLAFIEAIQLCMVIENSLSQVENSLYILKYLMVVSYFIIFTGIIAIYFLKKLSWFFEKQAEHRINQLRFNELNKIMSFQNQTANEMRNMKHDIKKHIVNILYLIDHSEAGEAKKYTDQLMQKVNYVKPSYKTGNHIVDIILNKHAAFCISTNIYINFLVDEVPNLKINDIDISAVIDNIFDNAIEAVSKKEVTSKWIEFKYFNYKGGLAIKMTNPYSGKLKFYKEQLITIKKNSKEHGYGLQSVHAIVEEYQGTLKQYSNKETFSIVIFLPL